MEAECSLARLCHLSRHSAGHAEATPLRGSLGARPQPPILCSRSHCGSRGRRGRQRGETEKGALGCSREPAVQHVVQP